jgi:hypothetical protein
LFADRKQVLLAELQGQGSKHPFKETKQYKETGIRARPSTSGGLLGWTEHCWLVRLSTITDFNTERGS